MIAYKNQERETKKGFCSNGLCTLWPGKQCVLFRANDIVRVISLVYLDNGTVFSRETTFCNLENEFERLAAFYGSKMKKIFTRREIVKINIIKACGDVMYPSVQLSLRLQSNLMVGITRVYKEQVVYFCDDIKSAWRLLQYVPQIGRAAMIDLQKGTIRKEFCTLPENLGDLQSMKQGMFLQSPGQIFPLDDLFFFPGGPAPGDGGPMSPPGSWPPPPPAGFMSPPGGGSPEIQRSPGSASSTESHQAERKHITIPEVSPTSKEPTIQIPDEVDIVPPLPEDDIHEPTRRSPIKPVSVDDPSKDIVSIIDQETGRLVPAPEDQADRKRKLVPGAEQLETPSGAGIEVSTPVPPRKRRRRRGGPPIDPTIILSNDQIRNNVADVSGTLRDRLVPPPPARDRLSVGDLFRNPSTAEVQREPFLPLWRNNAVIGQLSDIESTSEELLEGIYGVDGVQPMDISHDDTDDMGSPEVIRADITGESSAYERSRGSIRVEGTPQTPAEDLITPGTVSGGPTPETGARDRESDVWPRTGLEPIHEDVDVDEPLPMDDIPEIPVEEIGQFQEELLRRLGEEFGSGNDTLFSVACPPETTKRRTAVKSFYQFLELAKQIDEYEEKAAFSIACPFDEWHREGVVALTQIPHDIVIEKGPNF